MPWLREAPHQMMGVNHARRGRTIAVCRVGCGNRLIYHFSESLECFLACLCCEGFEVKQFV